MGNFGYLMDGFATVITTHHIVIMVIGVMLGILVGVLPGLGAPNGVSLLLPLTFTMDPISAIILLSCMYWGALFGGSTTSILFNIPGEPSSVATTFDGYPMARNGQATRALDSCVYVCRYWSARRRGDDHAAVDMGRALCAAVFLTGILCGVFSCLCQFHRNGCQRACQDLGHDDARLCPGHRRHGYDLGRVAAHLWHPGSHQRRFLPRCGHGALRDRRIAANHGGGPPVRRDQGAGPGT